MSLYYIVVGMKFHNLLDTILRTILSHFTHKMLCHLIQQFLYNNTKKIFLVVFWCLIPLEATDHVSLVVEFHCRSRSLTPGSPTGFPHVASKHCLPERCVWSTSDCVSYVEWFLFCPRFSDQRLVSACVCMCMCMCVLTLNSQCTHWDSLVKLDIIGSGSFLHAVDCAGHLLFLKR